MRRVGAGIAAVAVLTGATGVAGCGDADEGGQGLSIADIQAAFDDDEPGTVTGEKATLTGQVDELLSPSAFVIADEAEPLLVVAKDKRLPDEGDQVRVSGTVREFDFAEVKKRLGVDMAKSIFREHVGEPYLWAEKVKADIAE